ncbi:MAG: TetR/AcrR family transcriptional regulator [Solirubrobacteraceae bacterium]
MSTPPEPRRREYAPLPPGRHKLGRGFVATNQRERILDAVADVVSLSGYVDMRVEDIVVTAGVSRRTFYDHFSSKEEAFLASYEAVVEQLLTRVQAAYEANGDFEGRVCDCLGAFLDFVASEPAFADMCIVEVLAAGPQAIERRNFAMRALGALIKAAAADGLQTPPPPELTAETIVGGIYEVVYSRILQGEGPQLRTLLPDLAYSIMLPYIGHEAAAARMEAVRANPPAPGLYAPVAEPDGDEQPDGA